MATGESARLDFPPRLGRASCTLTLDPRGAAGELQCLLLVQRRFGNAVGRIADFTIDQASHQGEWVSHGPFTFPGDTVLVKVTDQGEGPPTADADPLRVTC